MVEFVCPVNRPNRPVFGRSNDSAVDGDGVEPVMVIHGFCESHSMTEVEIESIHSQQRPDADVYHTDSSNRAMAHGRGLDPRSHLVLEHGSQQQRGLAYDQRRGDRYEPPPYEPPPSPAGSKRKHPRKDATAGSRRLLGGFGSQTPSIRSASIGPFESTTVPCCLAHGQHHPKSCLSRHHPCVGFGGSLKRHGLHHGRDVGYGAESERRVAGRWGPCQRPFDS
jgi:hypothetical protein